VSSTFTQKVGGKLSSRRSATILAIGALVLAAILLIAYVRSYRNSVSGEAAPTTVLVAKALIPAGTSGTIIGAKELYETTTLPRREVKIGAIGDPAVIKDRVTTTDILPGQQLMTGDFSTGTTDAVITKITGPQRALSVSIDNVHGSLSQLQAGNHIDLYVGLGARGGQSVVKLFRPNVEVLAVPVNGAGNLVLKVNTKDAADFAYAADNTQLWFVLRPQSGATPTRPSTASITSLTK
jgi:Flp pilus assembly protein CpaB